MSFPRLYFVRHGESFANQTGIAAGSSESPLTKLGLEQAHKEADIILQKSIKFDKIISSLIARAFDTACIIARQIGFDENAIITSDLLRERHIGSFEGKTLNEFTNASETDKEAAGCEKLVDLYNRVKDANNFILATTKNDENVLIVGHSGYYRMARCVAEGLEPEVTYSLDQPQNSTLLEYPMWQNHSKAYT